MAALSLRACILLFLRWLMARSRISCHSDGLPVFVVNFTLLFLPVLGIINSNMTDPIKDALEVAQANLSSSIRQRQEINVQGQKVDKEIAKWRRVVESLTAVREDD